MKKYRENDKYSYFKYSWWDRLKLRWKMRKVWRQQ